MTESTFHESWPQLLAILVPFMSRCGAAVLCGALIGLERELKGKPAGFRTNILISLGSAMYMSVGLLLNHEGGETGADPSRIAAQVVTGIGFIGAGCIIQERGRVTGLTSAATIWVVAAIGIISGAGFPVLAFISAVIVVVTLSALGWFEKRYLEAGTSDDPRTDD
jgi:putative Mg2+ transporter-C (MgtC) family protein